MVRRAFLRRLALAVAVASASCDVAFAGPVDDIVAEIRSQGFKIQHLQKTWLGRVRIIATSPDYRREVVIDPTTGEIRRDLLVPRTDGGNQEDGPPVPDQPAPAPNVAPNAPPGAAPTPTRSQASPGGPSAPAPAAPKAAAAHPAPAAAPAAHPGPDLGASRGIGPVGAGPGGAKAAGAKGPGVEADWGGGWGTPEAPAAAGGPHVK